MHESELLWVSTREDYKLLKQVALTVLQASNHTANAIGNGLYLFKRATGVHRGSEGWGGANLS